MFCGTPQLSLGMQEKELVHLLDSSFTNKKKQIM